VLVLVPLVCRAKKAEPIVMPFRMQTFKVEPCVRWELGCPAGRGISGLTGADPVPMEKYNKVFTIYSRL